MSNDPPQFQLSQSQSDNELTLSERVARLEKQLEDLRLLIPDVDRYETLQKLLAAGQWKAADQETTRIMLEVCGEDSKEDLAPEDILRFPCNVIKVIDRLWRKYSGDRFGFSVQLRLYQVVGGNLDTLRAQNMEILMKVSERVGRRVNDRQLTYDELDFTLSAPIGILPAHWWSSPYGIKMVNFFFMRLISCQIEID